MPESDSVAGHVPFDVGAKAMTNAEDASKAAGLSLEQAAKRARVGARYLRQCELHGGTSYVLAQRLAWLYGCPIDVFLHGSKRNCKGSERSPKPQ